MQQRLFDCVKYKTKKTASEKQVVARVKQQKQLKAELALNKLSEQACMQFSGSSHTDIHQALPVTWEDYFALVDTTGRALREDKRDAICLNVPPVLQRFGINTDLWLEQVKHFDRRYSSCAGRMMNMQAFVKKKGRRWPKRDSRSAKIDGSGCPKCYFIV